MTDPSVFNQTHLRALLAPRREAVLAALREVSGELSTRGTTVEGQLVPKLMRRWVDASPFTFDEAPTYATFRPLGDKRVRYTFSYRTRGDVEIMRHALHDTPHEKVVRVTDTGLLLTIDADVYEDQEEVKSRLNDAVTHLKSLVRGVANFVASLKEETRCEVHQRLVEAVASVVQARSLEKVVGCRIDLRMSDKEDDHAEHGGWDDDGDAFARLRAR